MSYSSDLKSELITARVKNNCCRKNIAIAMAAVLLDSPDLRNREVREYFYSLISEFFHTDKAFEARSGEPLSSTRLLKCANCRSALLRGLFLAVGSMNDPLAYEYNLDFTFRTEAAADDAEALLSICGFEVKRRTRRASYVLYIKSSDTLGEFFAAAGNNRVMFDITNARMEAEVRGTLNRANNTDISNINKSTAASERVCEAIKFLIESEKLHLLDETLYKTAMLRYENPELSLFQLTAMIPEGVSKSTLNARLRRITELADKYRKK